MIEEPTLPDGVTGTGVNFACKNSLQSPNPIAELKVVWQCHKQVYVIRKNYITPHRNPKIILRALAEPHESFMDTIIRKMRSAPACAARYEIERVARENNIEPSWCSWEFCHSLLLRSGLAPYK